MVTGEMVENERLRQSVMYVQWQLERLPETDPKRAELHAELAHALLRLFEQSADVAVLREAITACRTAIALTPDEHPDIGRYHLDLRRLLSLLFTKTTDFDQGRLEQALRWSYPMTGLADASTAGATLPVCLAELSSALLLEYQWSDAVAALRDAVRTARRVVELTPAHDPALDEYRTSLTRVLWILSGRDSDLAILDEASSMVRESLRGAGRENGDLATRLDLLALILKRRYELTGDVPALRDAVETGREALSAGSRIRQEAASFKANLADELRMLSERTSDLAMARDAVSFARKAVAELRADDTEWAGAQAVLGSSLTHLAERTNDGPTTADAVRETRKAVAATAVNHAEYLPRLNVLYRALMNQHSKSGGAAVLEETLDAARDLVGTAPSDDSERGKYLSHLSLALREFYLAGAGNVGQALNDSIEFARQAVAATPPNHPDRAAGLASLSDLLRLKYLRTQDPDLLRESIAPNSTIAKMSGASVSQRITAAQAVADADLRLGRVRHATTMIRLATELLPQLGLRDVDRADREHRVSVANKLPATAAAVAIAAGQPGYAVELLEQTRGVVFAGTLDTREDTAVLRTAAPDLLARFEEIRSEINSADHEMSLPSFGEHRDSTARHSRELAARRASLNEQWDELLDQIRLRPGLSGFQRPTPIADLSRHAGQGPVIYITADESRAHALIVRDDPDEPVVTVNLPAVVSRSTVLHQAELLRAALWTATDRDQPARARRDAQPRMLDVLRWVWDNIAEPVLVRLGHTATPTAGRAWSRVWWCPVGVVTMLPLHAAGDHRSTGSAETVMDRVISSYTPTIRALAHARRDTSGTPSSLVVAVPDAPQSPPLYGAEQEADIVRGFIPDVAVLPESGGLVSRDTVVEALSRHGVVHLACHGYADLRNPSTSRLLLHDHVTNPLTLHTITRLDLRHARLVYLSACSTTDTNQEQADEATHLTAAFQLAGYRSVIGTLWPINDQTAVTVATDFYAGVTADRTKPVDHKLAAEALHRAVRTLRDMHPRLPSRWAAYIHSGA